MHPRAYFVSTAAVVGVTLAAAAAAEPPKEHTPEYTVQQSLKLIRDGQLDQWIAQWCSPDLLCRSASMPELREFGLARAERNAKLCLHGPDDSIQVTRVKGDPAKDPDVTIWVKCEEERMPVPATLHNTDGRWLVRSFSW